MPYTRPEGYYKVQYQKRKKSQQEYYQAHKEDYRLRSLKYIAENPELVRKQSADRDAQVKLEVLSYYGKEGRLQCCWPDCGVIDPDMLSLDHVNNDGQIDRKQGKGGIKLYRVLRTEGYRPGFQTLCHNHQWKKEIMRRREGRGTGDLNG